MFFYKYFRIVTNIWEVQVNSNKYFKKMHKTNEFWL